MNQKPIPSTQWNSTQQKERRSSYPLSHHGWNGAYTYLPLVPPPNQGPEEGRMTFSISNCLTSLVCAYCNVSSCCHLSQGWWNLLPGAGHTTPRRSVYKVPACLPRQCGFACCCGLFVISSCDPSCSLWSGQATGINMTKNLEKDKLYIK